MKNRLQVYQQCIKNLKSVDKNNFKMEATIPGYLMIILCNIIRDQNEQLLKIICEDKNIKFAKVKNLIPTSKKIIKYVEDL